MCADSVPGRGVNDGDRHAIGVEIEREARGRMNWRDLLRDRFGGDSRYKARFSGASVANHHNSHAGPSTGA